MVHSNCAECRLQKFCIRFLLGLLVGFVFTIKLRNIFAKKNSYENFKDNTLHVTINFLQSGRVKVSNGSTSEQYFI